MTPALEQLDPNFKLAPTSDGLAWYDVRGLGVEGRGWSEAELDTPFDRLPARAKNMVREPVWTLSQRSAGMCVRFVTDARAIEARWTLRFESLAMDHMPATGVSGLDLYARDGERWRWLGVGRPTQLTDNRATLTANLDPGRREYLLYLPLYNGVTAVSLGLAPPPDTTITKAPPRTDKSICFYGTSIVQGGCASRTGMAYPAILGRRLNRPTFNLGFSGNGKIEPEVAQLLAELDPSVYVLDPLPNNQAQDVHERIEPFVRTLRAARPATPIVMVENVTYQAAWARSDLRDRLEKVNTALRQAHQRLLAAGVTGLHYVPADDLFGHDGEATVDGTHATDVGFLRIAAALEPVLRPLV